MSFGTRRALSLAPWWERYERRLTVSVPILQTTSPPPEITFCDHREIHVYFLPRRLWAERACWITTCFRTTGGEWKPRSAQPSAEVIAPDIPRTADIQSTQEANCETVYLSLQTQC